CGATVFLLVARVCPGPVQRRTGPRAVARRAGRTVALGSLRHRGPASGRHSRGVGTAPVRSGRPDQPGQRGGAGAAGAPGDLLLAGAAGPDAGDDRAGPGGSRTAEAAGHPAAWGRRPDRCPRATRAIAGPHEPRPARPAPPAPPPPSSPPRLPRP